MSTPKQALQIMATRGLSVSAGSTSDIVRQQREELDRKADPSMVVEKKRAWNPFSMHAKMRRAAEEAALTARLEIFRDNLLAVRKTNEVLSRGAITEVAIAVEDYLTRILAESASNKYRFRHEASLKMKKVFTEKLADLQAEAQRKVINEDMLEAMINAAYLEFAEESAKLGKINVEFDKTQLLSVTFDPSR
jgi:hypothetical protein